MLNAPLAVSDLHWLAEPRCGPAHLAYAVNDDGDARPRLGLLVKLRRTFPKLQR